MKSILKFAICILTMTIFFASCKKDSSTQNPQVQNPVTQNKPPVARAGDDRSVTFSCNAFSLNNGFELDGGGSYDPDGNISNYKWIAISGPQGCLIRTPTKKNTLVENVSSGKYEFELTVTDGGGLSTKDSVIITVNEGAEYDLNITINTTYNFYDNMYDTLQYTIPEDNFDLTEIIGKANLLPLGEFDIYVLEYADTASLSNNIYLEYIQISIPGANTPYLAGTFSINFKKLIREGGGPFSGTFKITQGSATRCNPNVFSSLPPLQFSGSLNVATSMVSLNIRGKVYF